MKRFALKIFIISDSYFGFLYVVCLTFKIFNDKKLWEMIGERCGYVAGGAFILVAVNKYVVDKCRCSACYSSRKCYLRHEIMREYYFKKLTDACCL